MANTINWGQAAVDNTIDYGQGATDNTISWGKSQTLSPGGETNITGGGGFADTTSLLYDGVDDYQETSAWSTIDGVGEFTISLWLKLDSMATTNRVLWGYESGTNNNLHMYVLASGRVDVFSGGDASNWTRSAVGAITLNNWHHVVMRLLPTSIEPNRYLRQRVFIDGVLNHSSSAYVGGTIPNGTSLAVGADPNYSNIAYFQPTSGNINEVAIWNTALTDAQILEVYNGGSANDLKTLPTAPIPTNWYRSENALWLGGAYYETSDEMGNGAKLNTRNMVEASRVNDVPT